jgi:predicted Zn-dependent protease
MARWLTAIPLLLLAVYVARPPNNKIVQRMERELNRSRYELVAGHRTKRLLKSKHAGRASLYRATALLALGAYQEAGLFLQSLTMQARPDAATYHLLNAHALSGIGSKDAAARELAACIALVPSYGAEASQIPLLAPLVGRAYALSPDYA